MDRTARVRWCVLLGALALTIGAIVYPVDEAEDTGEVVGTERPPAHTPDTPPASEQDIAEPSTADAETEDPFAPRGWQAPPPAPVVAASVAAAPAVMVGPPAPPAPPPLPYKFMGRLNDEGAEVVYLSKGDQPLIARDGETLDGTYKIVAMHAQQIDFEYLPTGDKQTLTIPASEK